MLQAMPFTLTKEGKPEDEEAMKPTLTGLEPELRACQSDDAVPEMIPLDNVALARFQDPVRVR